MSDPSKEIPDLIGVGTQAVAETAGRLGLTWGLRPAEVAASNPLTVVYDGDTEPIGMVSLVGFLDKGVRCMAVFVPPAGNYVVGRFSYGDVGRLSFMEYAVATADTSLNTVEAAVPGLSFTVTTSSANARWDASGVFTFRETVIGTVVGIGRLYVDNTLQGATALFGMTAVDNRASVAQNWSGSFTVAGEHTFQARVARNANNGTQNANQTNTTLLVKVYE